jgi:putative ABC transport system permease protein
MDKRFVAFVVRRYLRFDPEQPFIFLSALLAFIGIAVGVMVLIVAMAIMNGFDKEFEKKLFTMNYPLTIYPKFSRVLDEDLLARLEREFADLRFSPYISSQVIYKKGDRLEGGMVFGVDFKRELTINEVLRQAIKVPPGRFEAVVGSGIREHLYLQKGDKLFFIFPKGVPSGLSIAPTFKRFKIAGEFTSGLIAYDRSYSYTTIDSLRPILRIKEGFSGIHVYSPKPQKDIKRLKLVLPDDVDVLGWWQQNGNFFAALKMEKRALFIVLMLIILIASLNIISSLLMTVMNRRKEIALMLTLGATPKEIEATFFRLGSIIGGLGIAVGVALGLLGVWLLGRFDIVELPADVYGTSHLPLELSATDLALIIAGAILIILASSIYPAKRATRIDPIAVLRNE